MGGEAEGGFVAPVAEGGWLQNQECEKKILRDRKKSVYLHFATIVLRVR